MELKSILILLVVMVTVSMETDVSVPDLSSEPFVYTATFMSHDVDPLIFQWTLERNIINEVLLFWSDERQTAVEENLVTVSSKRLTDSEFEEALDAWQTKRQNIGYLHLSCPLSDNGRAICICTKYVRSRLENDSLYRQRTEVLKGSDWKMESIYHCDSLPPLTRQVFRGFEAVAALVLDRVGFGVVEADAFQDFLSIELLRITGFSVTSLDGIPEGAFCTLNSLRAVQIYGGSGPEEKYLEAIPKLLNCKNETASQFSTMSIDIRYLSMNELKTEYLSGIDPDNLWIISLPRNSIRDMDSEVFNGFSKVIEMDLSENQLTSLKPHVFDELLGLGDLNLAFSMLETLNISVFQNLQELMLLNLTGNRIVELEGSFSILYNLQYLDMRLNRLTEIDQVTFSNVTNLTRLVLGGNQISRVHSDAFTGSLQLWDLDLSSNLLSNESSIAEFLENKVLRLIQLDLGNNSISCLTYRMFSQYINANRLNAIYLDNNIIEDVHMFAFSHVPFLEVLFLGNNKITALHPFTFILNPILFAVFLDNNFLETLPIFPDSLQKLYVSGNRIKRLPLFDRTMPNLENLHLASNNITSLDDYFSAQFPAVTNLNASNCSLVSISDTALVNVSGLQVLDLSLNNLDLDFSVNYVPGVVDFEFFNISHNRIRSIEGLFRHNFRFATIIDASHNPLGILPSEKSGNEIMTRKLFLRNCSLRKISEDALEKASMISLIDLSSNDLTEFKPLKISEMAKRLHYQVLLANNPIQCSCRMKWLLDNEYSPHYYVPFCYQTTTGTLEPLRSVKIEDFLCRVPQYCNVGLPQCDCYTDDINKEPFYLNCSNKWLQVFPRSLQESFKVVYFQGNSLETFKRNFVPTRMEKMQKLFLDRNRIENIEEYSFENFPNLQLLSLSGNRLSRLNVNTFSGLRRLKWLYLDNNIITGIDGLAFKQLSLLNALTLHGNSLTSLNQTHMDDISSLGYLTKLTLSQNPWSCSCDNATFRYWIQKYPEVITDTSTILCNKTPIITLPDESFVCWKRDALVNELQITAPLIFACIFCAFLLPSILLFYRFRYVLQVLIYNSFGIRRNVQENDQCVYDALTIYDSSNVSVRAWIRELFLPYVEPKFRFYIPERDMLPGTDRFSELVTAIKLSRRTVIILSPDAVKVSEILAVFEAAYHRMTLERSQHRLALVLLEGVNRKSLSLDSDISQNFKACLTTKKCLSVMDRFFWHKLNFFLPSPQQSSSVETYDNPALEVQIQA